MQVIGAGSVLPHFAIRVSDNATDLHHECLVVGVTSVKSVDSVAAMNGQDKNCYVLFSSRRDIWGGENSVAERGIMAMHAALPLSHLLATSDQMFAVDHRQPDTGISGAMIKGKTTVIGIVRDLEANSMRFYVNDQILRVTAERYPAVGPYLSQLVDTGIAVGEPFVWKLPADVNLGRCYPYFCAFQSGIRAEFIEWSPQSKTDETLTDC